MSKGHDGEAAAGALLAWDTCTEEGVIAIGRAGALLSCSRFRTVKGHAGWLMPLVDSALQGAGLEPGDLEAVACGAGPGGYTGVKVGVTTAKAVSLALDIPVVPVPTLDLLAAHVSGGPVFATIDAKQGLLYAAGYSTGGPLPERVTDYMRVTPAEAGRAAAAMGPGKVMFAGEVALEMLAAAESGGIEPFVEEVGFPGGEVLLVLASGMLAAGLGRDAVSALPMYLRKPV